MTQIIIVIILFVLVEVVSYLYQKQLNKLSIARGFLWLGIFVHEFAHYLACKLTFAPVQEFKVGLREGHVTHGRSRIPVFGSLLISLAPLIVGLVVITLLFAWYFSLGWTDLLGVRDSILNLDWTSLQEFGRALLDKISLLDWRFWLFLFLSLNLIATFIPSKQDFKNVAVILVVYVILSVILPFLSIVNSFLIFVLAFALGLLIIAFLLSLVFVLIKKLLLRGRD